MAEITATATQIQPTRADLYDSIAGIAGEAITAGMPCYISTDGKWYVSDANDAADDQCHGIAVRTAASGGATEFCIRGTLAGYTLTSIGIGSLVYVSNTVGSLDSAAGSTSVVVGKCIVNSEGDTTRKELFVDIPFNS